MANLGDILSVPTPASSGGSTVQPIYIPTSNGNSDGGGLASALVLSSLMGKRDGCSGDYGRDRGVDGAVIAAINAAISANETLSSLGDIKASVPLAEGQVQLALAQAVQALQNSNAANTNLVINGQTQAMLTSATNQALLARDIAGVNANVSSTGCDIINAVRDDGNATRALITQNTIAELNRIAEERQDEIIELRYNQNRERDKHGIDITMINNQNQNQLQFQQQAQVLNQLSCGIVDALQSIRATNQAINIGSGVMSASPTNTNTNVRA